MNHETFGLAVSFVTLQVGLCMFFYERGRLVQARVCRKLLDESHLWHAMALADVKARLRPWLGDSEMRQ